MVSLAQSAPWSLALLLRQICSFAGDFDRSDVSRFLVQPFINCKLDGHCYLVTEPGFTAKWEADSDQRWTVPIGGGFGHRSVRLSHGAAEGRAARRRSRPARGGPYACRAPEAARLSHRAVREVCGLAATGDPIGAPAGPTVVLDRHCLEQ